MKIGNPSNAQRAASKRTKIAIYLTSIRQSIATPPRFWHSSRSANSPSRRLGFPRAS